MTHRVPVRVADRDAFDAIIDARSPSEFALDHIPGAINCPVLDDDERRIVGTLYVQVGAFEAKRVGGAMVAANLARRGGPGLDLAQNSGSLARKGFCGARGADAGNLSTLLSRLLS